MFLDSTSTMKFGARPYKFLLDHFYLYDFSISKVTASLKVSKIGCIIYGSTSINIYILVCLYASLLRKSTFGLFTLNAA